VFNFYIDVGKEVVPSTFGTITKFERTKTDHGDNYVDLEILTDDGRTVRYEKAKGSNYKLGTRIQVHEYRTKYTNRTAYVFRE
jgi:hypothetical protein